MGGENGRFMRRAIEMAHRGRRPGASPIGCVIVRDGVVIGEAHNEVGLRCNATAHAEMVAIERAQKALGTPELRGATLYSTLQPCGMCTMASIWSKVGALVYGAERDQVHEMYFEDRHFDTMDFIRDAFRDDLKVVGGVLSAECAALYHGPDDDPPAEERGNV